jgi:hypothetical protein
MIKIKILLFSRGIFKEDISLKFISVCLLVDSIFQEKDKLLCLCETDSVTQK